jgi:hypothetical protein
MNGNIKIISGDRSASQALGYFPLPVLLFVLSMVLPIEMSVYIGPIFMTPSKFIYIILMPVVLVEFFKDRDKYTFDLMFAIMVFWICLGYVVKLGSGGLQPLGQAFLEITIPYLVARQYLTTQDILKKFIFSVGAIVLVLAILAIPEGLLHSRYLHMIPRMVTGIVYDMQADTRLGLLRSASTFENPILFGLFSASMFSMIVYGVNSARYKIFFASGCIIATFLSLSSAAMLLLVFQISAVIFEHKTVKVPRRTLIVTLILSVLFLFIEVASNRGIVRVVISNLTFSPHTGYYRLLQWDFAQDDVRRYPVWGMPNVEAWTRPYWMTASIDNNWLLSAMKNGIPVVSLVFAIFATLVVKNYRRKRRTPDVGLRRLMTGWIIAILAIFMGGWTVALFGKMQPMLYFMVGMGAAILRMPEIADAADESRSLKPQPNRYLPHSRFPMRARKDANLLKEYYK